MIGTQPMTFPLAPGTELRRGTLARLGDTIYFINRIASITYKEGVVIVHVFVSDPDNMDEGTRKQKTIMEKMYQPKPKRKRRKGVKTSEA